jgi:hypothetical protein
VQLLLLLLLPCQQPAPLHLLPADCQQQLVLHQWHHQQWHSLVQQQLPLLLAPEQKMHLLLLLFVLLLAPPLLPLPAHSQMTQPALQCVLQVCMLPALQRVQVQIHVTRSAVASHLQHV